MPEYLAPGVFIEETSFRHKSIEGVGTSVAALVGPTRSGPLRGVPEVVTSFNDFVRTFGDLQDLDFGSGSKIANHTALAAKAFFENGGKQLYVSRVVNGINSSNTDGEGSSASCARSDPAKSSVVTFKSRFPGTMGNYWLEIIWRNSVNLFATETTTTPEVGEVLFLNIVGDTEGMFGSGNEPKQANGDPLVTGKYPISLSAVVKKTSQNRIEIQAGEAKDKDGGDVDISGTKLDTTTFAASGASVTLTRVRLKSPATGPLVEGDYVELSLDTEHDLSAYTGVGHWGSLTVLRGTLKTTGGRLATLHLPQSMNDGIAGDLDIPIAAFASLLNGEVKLLVQRNFDLNVLNGDENGEVIYSRANLSTSKGNPNSLDKVLSSSPEKTEDRLHQPISCTLGAGDVASELYQLFESGPINFPDPLRGARYLIQLTGGNDGTTPVAVDYAGEVDDSKGNTGLAALEDIEDVSIVMTPAAAAHSNSHAAVVLEMQKHCRKMRYRIGIVDSREGMTLGDVREFRNGLSDDCLALYHPWVVIADPTGQKEELKVPPAGFMAGIYARTDVNRGVHKAPANEVVLGALRFGQEINKFQQELLNPEGINCLRSFPGRGHRVWGGRTLSGDPEWKYINVRRYFYYLERSIEKSTQWAVFEPNGEALWANIRSTVEDFLFNEWKNRRLLGSTPKEAYFVRCDRSTMTQNDLDNGRMVCEVGVAALTPAEFVIFRIGQKTASA